MCLRRATAALAAVWFLGALCCQHGSQVLADESAAEESSPPGKIVRVEKTDAEWRKQLTGKQFDVTRRKATELAFSGKYVHNKRAGIYRCVCCDLDLFSSDTKFDSQTGWPSFWAPIDKQHVQLAPDMSELEPRTEVLCARCAAHLGHVFGDGPPPTGLRFCINSAALNFEAAKDKPAGRPRSSSARSKSRRTEP